MAEAALKLTPEKFADIINPQLEKLVGEKLGPMLEEKFKELNGIPINRKAMIPDDYSGEKKRLDDGGYDTLGKFLLSVSRAGHGNVDSRLKVVGGTKFIEDAESKTAGHWSEGTNSEGGFLVFPEFYNQIMMQNLEQAIFRAPGNGAMILPMRSESLSVPRVVDSSHSSSVYGGVIAYWKKEGGTPTATRAAWGMANLTAKKLIGLTYASNELLADSAFPLETLITRMFGGAITWFEEKGFVAGTGSGEPLGISNAGCTVEVSAESGQGADVLYPANLAKMYSRMLPGSVSRAIWIANPTILPHLITLSQSVGTGGHVVWIDRNAGMTNTPPTRILGRPVYFTEHCQAAGTSGDIWFADLGSYLIGDRQELLVAASPHTAFTTDEIAWRFTQRVDGQPWLSTYITPANGDTRAPFVKLATRS